MENKNIVDWEAVGQTWRGEPINANANWVKNEALIWFFLRSQQGQFRQSPHLGIIRNISFWGGA